MRFAYCLLIAVLICSVTTRSLLQTSLLPLVKNTDSDSDSDSDRDSDIDSANVIDIRFWQDVDSFAWDIIYKLLITAGSVYAFNDSFWYVIHGSCDLIEVSQRAQILSTANCRLFHETKYKNGRNQKYFKLALFLEKLTTNGKK